MSTPPKRLRRLPLKGATLAAWQSRLRSVPGLTVTHLQGAVHARHH